MPRITKAMLVAENTNLKARLEESEKCYWSVTEAFQKLCEDYDCPAGAHRIEWLRAKIERLRDALTAVHAEVNLSKAPKLMAKIEAALGINQQTPRQRAKAELGAQLSRITHTRRLK